MEDILNRLGFEAANANFLSISDVDLLLQHFKSEGETNSLFNKIHEYVKRYNRFPNPQITKQVRDLLTNHEFSDNLALNEQQIVLMMNLCPETVEEAVRLIPDLEKFRESELQEVLDGMVRLKHMQ